MTTTQLHRAAHYQRQLIDDAAQQADLLDLAALNQPTAEDRAAVQATANALRVQGQRLILELHELEARLPQPPEAPTPPPAVFDLSDEAIPEDIAHRWLPLTETAIAA
ncbi:hypothetical protein GCM10023213_14270 [Prosthecobacter algae]|uniref:Uncharacterized protein n=1 Tax=Prosthecobacter algae TaxID=1144682 RepID=A0ABP9NZG5_9BACT